MTTPIASMGAAASAAAAPVVATVAAAAPAATKAGITTTGWLGLSAGAVGIAVTALDTWKDAVASQEGFKPGSVVNPTTIAIGGGTTMLVVGEKAAGSNLFLRNGMRAGGIALALGGLVGAVAGAVQTFGNPLKSTTEAATSSQSQAPVRFGTMLPPAPANLTGVQLASAEVIEDGRKLKRIPVYADPATAARMPDGTTLGGAIGQARAATQLDPEFRSHAVVQTADGAYWTMRLSGDLDQVDGRNYSKDNTFDARYEPQIGRRQQALQAIAGVEGNYVFPQGMESTAPAQYAGDIPWVTPGTDPAAPAPAPATDPAAPAPAPTDAPTTAEAGS